MANEKKSKVPEGGNSGELKRVTEECDRYKKAVEKINGDLQAVTRERDELRIENGKLNNLLNGATARIKNLEESVSKEDHGVDNVKEGWVTIASCPLPNGTKPQRIINNGVAAPRTIDADGICIEEMPVPTAVSILAEGSGFKRYLTGPVNSITGKVRVGVYMKDFTFHRHKKVDLGNGKYEFQRVIA